MKFTANRNNNFNSSGENDNDNSNDDHKNHSIASGRYGGSLSALHGGVSMAMRMPELLEGKPPSSYDISAAQELGLFSIEGLTSPIFHQIFPGFLSRTPWLSSVSETSKLALCGLFWLK